MTKKTENEVKYDILNVDGTKYRTHFSDTFREKKKWVPDNPNLITATIPGTILKVCVKVGQKVAAGRCLYMLEAMKMINRFNAEKACIIKSIHVEEGDKVPKKHLLIEIEDIPVKTSRRISSKSK